MKKFKIVCSFFLILGILIIAYRMSYRNISEVDEKVSYVVEELASKEEQIIETILGNYQLMSSDAIVSEKKCGYGEKSTITRYMDSYGNVLRYQMNKNSLVTDYYLSNELVLIKITDSQKKENEQTEWWLQEGDEIHNISGEATEERNILTIQEIELLYEKLLDEQEKDGISDDVVLQEQLETDVINDYERYLTFQDIGNIQCVYSYNSDKVNISTQQAINLCVAILKVEEPDLLMEEVMQYEDEGYVGYRFNLREVGEGEWKQTVENRIGILGGDIVFDGMKYEVDMYEHFIDDVETGEGHIAATATFHVFLKDKIIVLE